MSQLKMKRITGCLLMGLLAACGASKDANRANLTSAVTRFLDAHGDMCVGKVDWPIDVTMADAQSRSANSLQLPALQKAGLVSAQQVQGAPNPVMRFSLTAEGQKYYVHKRMASVAAEGRPRMHEGDLCYGKLHVDQVIGWEPPRNENGVMRTAVTYTYSIDAAPWTKDADIQRVFPVLAMVVKSGGTLQLKQVVVLTANGWEGRFGVD
jgi:DNA-binding transcriptional ArsR family regulator